MEAFGPIVDVEWLSGSLDDVHVFDSRSYLDGRSGRDEFARGHIAGAVFVELDTDLAAPPSQPGGRHPFPTAEHFAEAMGRLGYDGSRPAVVYDDVGGGMAARLWFMLRLLDLPAAVLDGGLQAWRWEIDTGPNPVDPVTFEVRPWPTDRLVEADDVARRLESGDVVMDARSHSRYLGKENRIDPRFGHIPGAISMAWEDNIDDFTGAYLSRDELAQRYRTVTRSVATGGRPIAYCGSGVTACHDLLALELLGVEADLYVGSWSEWGADETRPVETGDGTD